MNDPSPKKRSVFRYHYDRRDLPLRIVFAGAIRRIEWKADLDELDYHFYLPIFFHGLMEKEDPMTFIVDKGLDDLLENGKD